MEESVFFVEDNHLQESKQLKTFDNIKAGLDAAFEKLGGGYHFIGQKNGAITVAYADKTKGAKVKKMMQSAGFHVDERWRNNKLELGITWVFKSKSLGEGINEDEGGGGEMGGQMSVGTDDMAQGDQTLKKRPAARIEPNKSFKGMPCFDLEKSDEYHSFCKGVKTFKQWGQHTKSQDIRNWANQNKGKSFYVAHAENYTYVNRSKK